MSEPEGISPDFSPDSPDNNSEYCMNQDGPSESPTDTPAQPNNEPSIQEPGNPSPPENQPSIQEPDTPSQPDNEGSAEEPGDSEPQGISPDCSPESPDNNSGYCLNQNGPDKPPTDDTPSPPENEPSVQEPSTPSPGASIQEPGDNSDSPSTTPGTGDSTPPTTEPNDISPDCSPESPGKNSDYCKQYASDSDNDSDLHSGTPRLTSFSSLCIWLSVLFLSALEVA